MLGILLYIDPGSGSYLIQAIIAGVLGVAFFFKNIAFAVKHFFQQAKTMQFFLQLIPPAFANT